MAFKNCFLKIAISNEDDCRYFKKTTHTYSKCFDIALLAIPNDHCMRKHRSTEPF